MFGLIGSLLAYEVSDLPNYNQVHKGTLKEKKGQKGTTQELSFALRIPMHSCLFIRLHQFYLEGFRV